MEDIISYIKCLLCYGDAAAADQIGYTADESEWEKYKVVIVPNGHLSKSIVLPYVEGIRTQTVACKEHKTHVILDDILYTCFFFISRAEELLVNERDEHGRFAAKYSLLGNSNRLQIPLLDEYSRSVMKLLGLSLPGYGFNKVYLTHDIDTIAHYRHLRGFAGGLLRKGWQAVWQAQLEIHNDPAYTFPWVVEHDAKVKNAECIYFVKDTKGRGHDYPQYNLHGKDWRRLKNYLEFHHAKLGLHSSYYGTLPKQMAWKLHRSHYLRCSIKQMRRLADAGITDDFTMGFADMAGFRLQTSRSVRWIDPERWQLTDLTLHPLTIMDCTLSNDNYMHLTEDEAYYYCAELIEKVKQHHGDLCLLWHNHIFAENNYHKHLYPALLELL